MGSKKKAGGKVSSVRLWPEDRAIIKKLRSGSLPLGQGDILRIGLRKLDEDSVLELARKYKIGS